MLACDREDKRFTTTAPKPSQLQHLRCLFQPSGPFVCSSILLGYLCIPTKRFAVWQSGVQSFLKTWTARKLLMHAQCLIYTLSLLIFEILEFNLLSLRFLCYSESSALLSILFVLTAPSVRQGVLSDSFKQKVEISESVIMCGCTTLQKPNQARIYIPGLSVQLLCTVNY